MFVKQRQAALDKLPRTDPFSVGAFVLEDARALQDQEHTAEDLVPIRRAWDRLQNHVDRFRPNTRVCASDRSISDRYRDAFDAYRILNPDATTDDFDESGYEPTIDDTDVDPRLGYITFTVSRNDRFLGLFHLYNVQIEHDGPHRVVITAYASPSFRTPEGYTPRDDLGRMMRALLERNVHLYESTRVLDLIEWQFPTRGSHRWVVGFSESLSHMDAHDRTDETIDQETMPKRIRRGGA